MMLIMQKKNRPINEFKKQTNDDTEDLDDMYNRLLKQFLSEGTEVVDDKDSSGNLADDEEENPEDLEEDLEEEEDEPEDVTD